MEIMPARRKTPSGYPNTSATDWLGRSVRDFVTPKGDATLARIRKLALLEWSYKADKNGYRHIGPMAEDFYAAFGLSVDDKHIAPSDVAGVALVAIKELDHMIQERDATIAALASRMETMEAKLAATVR